MSIELILATVLASALFGGWLFDWFIFSLALIYGKWLLHYPKEKLSPEDTPGVSIIKPLMGVDPNLKHNLETFFNLDYPSYELLFSVQDENDPAILLVKSLIESYPKADVKLFIGLKHVGPNGKINNMIRAYEAAKHNLILISDSGIKMNEDSLSEMASCMVKDVGLVLQMPYVCSRNGFASVYEQVYFGTMQARACLSANAVGVNCSTGMSMIFKKDVLEVAGGLQEFGKYLAEDYFIAQAIRNQGYKITLCTKPALQNSGNYSVTDFHKRLRRWAYMRYSMLPLFVFLEPLSECMIMGVAASWAVQFLFDFSPMGFFLLHVLLWFLLDYVLICVVQNGPLPFSKFEFVVAWLLRELSSPYILLLRHADSTIQWRNKKYKVRWGGITEEVTT
ncbi:hypothetical protein LOTGIDRAFT_214304 [Lottia gigantea]|uniref:ceramide glucosyltransferase n=1 Tax=Lottia gigantea TaxID=225164 RepID=V4A0X4_LOTGI|nr:hypothetical protein LOTGIDRAFT_214304 [Lottia gigantea]ESO97458.1 hypothetical protein LOTGIDRAFT_214304 [Lottia gigantea]